ncbi:MAG: 6-phosphogluconolactonase [Propionibacterium sp.]|nr:6-phosphogluconolactonase [Propionibacterium sp.]
MYTRVVRLPGAQDVVDLVAERLVSTIVDLQARQGDVHICLTGGQTANAMYEVFADLAATSDIDATKLHFWWGDERFVPATDPARNSLQAIERLARTIPIHSAHIHMMAAQDGRKDSHESASVYENELGNTRFDVTLMGLGEDGHCASIFQDHPSFDSTSRLVIGVEDSPKPPSDRITLTFNAINRSTDVWFLATGGAKAGALAAVLGGDDTLPATHVRGRRGTVWFVDEQAAGALPEQFRCEL